MRTFSGYREQGLLRESVPRQVDKESRGPQGERGLEFSRRKKGQTFFLSPHSCNSWGRKESDMTEQLN